MLCSAEVTCNQLLIITALLSAPGSWKKLKWNAPLNHLKVTPLSATSIIISDTMPDSWTREAEKLPPERAWSVSFELNSTILHNSLNHNRSSAQFDSLFLCRRACLSVDWFVSCESKILKKTYHHSFVWTVVYRPLAIDDYCIERSLISGFCLEDKWGKKTSALQQDEYEKNTWWVNILISMVK